ncbi:hypothetical protein NL676_009717 [Syzygium grande]|nr:hypothetical protein NL676_009717 [Syzygium grande]
MCTREKVALKKDLKLMDDKTWERRDDGKQWTEARKEQVRSDKDQARNSRELGNSELLEKQWEGKKGRSER